MLTYLRRTAIALVTAALPTVLAARSVRACSCAPADLPEQVATATDIFVGRAVGAPEPASDPVPEQRIGAEQPPTRPVAARLAIDLDVIEALKGTASGRVRVATPGAPSACGYLFHANEVYLVFARRDAAGWTTDLCMGNVAGEPSFDRADGVRRLVHELR